MLYKIGVLKDLELISVHLFRAHLNTETFDISSIFLYFIAQTIYYVVLVILLQTTFMT